MKLLGIFDDSNGLIGFFAIILISYMFLRFHEIGDKINGHWQTYFDNFLYSTQTFYNAVETALHGKGLPGVKISRITYHESTILSAEREYLRISREKDVFIICAAPFGKGFFISSRKGSVPSLRRKLAIATPILGILIAFLFFKKSYYQQDSQNMFVSAVHDTVLDVISNITKEQGVRDLTELERQFQRVGKQ